MKKYSIFGCLYLLLVFAPYLDAQNEEIQEVELDQIEVIEPGETTPSGLELAGRFHPMLIHFPIAWLVLLTMFDLYNQLRRESSWTKPVLYLHVLAMLSFIPAATTGLILAAHSGTDAGFLDLVTIHRNTNIAGASLCFLSLVLRVKAGGELRGKARIATLALLISATAAVLLASHYGGKIAFGENFLPF